jgi:hypothetical protein
VVFECHWFWGVFFLDWDTHTQILDQPGNRQSTHHFAMSTSHSFFFSLSGARVSLPEEARGGARRGYGRGVHHFLPELMQQTNWKLIVDRDFLHRVDMMMAARNTIA